MKDLSLQPAESELTSASRSRTVPGRSNRRQLLYSVVPDSAVLVPARRPDQYGRSGQTMEIYTNHFKVSMDDAIINQYLVEITIIRQDREPHSARKNERWATLQELARRDKNFPLVW